MKTLTEFPGLNLKTAVKTRQDLIGAGKSAEELPQAMGEALKLEGDRLGFLLSALEMIGTKLNDLKRVVVFSLGEGEKAPLGSIQKGEQSYLIEYYPSLAPKGGSNRDFMGGKPDGDKKGKGKHGKGRGGKRDDRGRGAELSKDGNPRQERPARPSNRRPHPAQAVNPAEKRVIAPKKVEETTDKA